MIRHLIAISTIAFVVSAWPVTEQNNPPCSHPSPPNWRNPHEFTQWAAFLKALHSCILKRLVVPNDSTDAVSPTFEPVVPPIGIIPGPLPPVEAACAETTEPPCCECEEPTTSCATEPPCEETSPPCTEPPTCQTVIPPCCPEPCLPCIPPIILPPSDCDGVDSLEFEGKNEGAGKIPSTAEWIAFVESGGNRPGRPCVLPPVVCPPPCPLPEPCQPCQIPEPEFCCPEDAEECNEGSNVPDAAEWFALHESRPCGKPVCRPCVEPPVCPLPPVCPRPPVCPQPPVCPLPPVWERPCAQPAILPPTCENLSVENVQSSSDETSKNVPNTVEWIALRESTDGCKPVKPICIPPAPLPPVPEPKPCRSWKLPVAGLFPIKGACNIPLPPPCYGPAGPVDPLFDPVNWDDYFKDNLPVVPKSPPASSKTPTIPGKWSPPKPPCAPCETVPVRPPCFTRPVPCFPPRAPVPCPIRQPKPWVPQVPQPLPWPVRDQEVVESWPTETSPGQLTKPWIPRVPQVPKTLPWPAPEEDSIESWPADSAPAISPGQLTKPWIPQVPQIPKTLPWPAPVQPPNRWPVPEQQVPPCFTRPVPFRPPFQTCNTRPVPSPFPGRPAPWREEETQQWVPQQPKTLPWPANEQPNTDSWPSSESQEQPAWNAPPKPFCPSCETCESCETCDTCPTCPVPFSDADSKSDSAQEEPQQEFWNQPQPNQGTWPAGVQQQPNPQAWAWPPQQPEPNPSCQDCQECEECEECQDCQDCPTCPTGPWESRPGNFPSFHPESQSEEQPRPNHHPEHPRHPFLPPLQIPRKYSSVC